MSRKVSLLFITIGGMVTREDDGFGDRPVIGWEYSGENACRCSGGSSSNGPRDHPCE